MNQSVSYWCISWDLYKSYISNAFNEMLKDEEFVDMTIAAEGHLVKAHQNIIALASPYIKEMLRSASCTHPVVFLNNVSHTILSYILEYIYTGEVNVPTDMVNSFIETSKSLMIKGIENLIPLNMNNKPSESIDQYKTDDNTDNIDCREGLDTRTTVDSNCAAHITINSSNYQVNVQKFTVQENQHNNTINNENNDLANNTINVYSDETPSQPIKIDYNTTILPVDQSSDLNMNDTSIYSASAINDNSNEKGKCADLQSANSSDCLKDYMNVKDVKPQYTISNRGALQLILNRYMYLCHHQSYGGRKRRWRCLDYRRKQCPAIIDTLDEVVTDRIKLHNHEFHDAKILKKYKKIFVYTTIAKAEKNRDAHKVECVEEDKVPE